jgi:hypothetical protein
MEILTMVREAARVTFPFGLEHDLDFQHEGT